jgi:hypothetical protein
MQTTEKHPTTPADLEWYKSPKRPIAEIIADLSKPIPKQYLDARKQGGQQITYIPWFKAITLLDKVTGAHWDYEVTNLHSTSKRIFIAVRLCIHAQEETFHRDATGTELLEVKFTDPSSRAESMALRRAAAKFGLALYLYSA